MADFTQTTEQQKELTIITVEGDIRPGEMLDYVERHYPAGGRSRRVIWDMRKATWSSIPTDLLLANLGKAARSTRPGYKTAFVLDREIDYGLGRIVENYSETGGFPGAYRPFKSLAEAEAWVLASGDHQGNSE